MTANQLEPRRSAPPLLIEIDAIVDHGTIVTMVGRDAETGRPVHVHFDHRPFAAFMAAWSAAGWPQPLSWDASTETLSFEGEEI